MENITIWAVTTTLALILPMLGLVIYTCIVLKVRRDKRTSMGIGIAEEKEDEPCEREGNGIVVSFIGFALAIIMYAVLPFRFAANLQGARIWWAVAVLSGIFIVVGFIVACLTEKGSNILTIAILLAVITFPFAYSAPPRINTVFDYSEPQTSLVTVDSRYIRSRHRGANRYLLQFSLEHEVYDEIAMSLRVSRNFYTSVRSGDQMFVCVKPGRLGYEWVSCVHRIDRATGQVHPGAPHAERFYALYGADAIRNSHDAIGDLLDYEHLPDHLREALESRREQREQEDE